MDTHLINRVLKEADLIISQDKTIREVAALLNVSKSTTYKDLKERLPKINVSLSEKVEERLKIHLLNRHLKGGYSTRLKYKKLK